MGSTIHVCVVLTPVISVAPLYSEKVYPEMLDHELLSNPDQVNANELLPER